MYKQVKKTLKRARKWMNYDPPGALSSKGWRCFKQEFKIRAPIRYWFAYTFRRAVIYPIKWKYDSISQWFRYRTTHRTHMISTGLTPGYYDIDTRMLHGSFNMLKDFVEIEQASREYWGSDEYSNASWCEKHMPFYYTVYPFRKPKHGIRHLEWSTSLDDPTLPVHDRCESQAIFARETLLLYNWWVNIRPARPSEEYVKYDDQGLGDLGSFDSDFDKDAPDYKLYISSIELRTNQEKDWKNEDTEMLVRLVRIRDGLWA